MLVICREPLCRLAWLFRFLGSPEGSTWEAGARAQAGRHSFVLSAAYSGGEDRGE